ncbi:hypothetical protein ACQP2Y_40340 [Actinoplanes sp. CA-051413]|uniref:hypothetical protein n=1 Tax=Actinoplanes sp. CA-051413 TaxID=3239899 RepID=UPI003D98A957
MSQAPADAEEIDEDHGSAIPEPPRRVPFAVTVTAALLGLLSLLLLVTAVVALSAGSFRQSVGEATAQGLAAALVAVCAALVAAVAWSFVRDGITVGPMIVGGLTLVAGLIMLVAGVAGSDPETEVLRLGVVALVIGLGVLLVPLLGQAPAYLAARRVWSRAERDWLHELTTPEAPPQPQWGPGHYPPPQQPQWGGVPQPHYVPPPGYPGQAGFAAQPGYPPQYQYPPQQAQGWGAQQHQAWPEAVVPPWSGQQQPVQPASGPPAPGVTAQPETGSVSGQTASGDTGQPQPQPIPLAAAQQAPTEQIRPADPTAPQHPAAPQQ